MSLLVLPGQSRVGEQSTSYDNTNQSGKAGDYAFDVIWRVYVTVVQQWFATSLVEGFKAIPVNSTFILLDA